jgi:hypothetical protein
LDLAQAYCFEWFAADDIHFWAGRTGPACHFGVGPKPAYFSRVSNWRLAPAEKGGGFALKIPWVPWVGKNTGRGGTMGMALVWAWALGLAGQGPSDGITEKALVRHWIHAREEDKDGVQVYRAMGTFEPRPSRFRMEYDLKAKGECRYMWLSPSDGHHLKEGTWKLYAGSKPGEHPVLEVREGKAVNRYTVVGLGGDVLRLKQEPAK